MEAEAAGTMELKRLWTVSPLENVPLRLCLPVGLRKTGNWGWLWPLGVLRYLWSRRRYAFPRGKRCDRNQISVNGHC